MKISIPKISDKVAFTLPKEVPQFKVGDRVGLSGGWNRDRDGNPVRVPPYQGGTIEFFSDTREYAFVQWFKGDPAKCIKQYEGWHPVTHLVMDPAPVSAPSPFYPPPTYSTMDGHRRPPIPQPPKGTFTSKIPTKARTGWEKPPSPAPAPKKEKARERTLEEILAKVAHLL